MLYTFTLRSSLKCKPISKGGWFEKDSKNKYLVPNLFYLLKHTALSSTSRVAHIPINSNDYIPCSICYTLHIIEIYTEKNSIKKAFPQRRKAYFLKHSSFFPKLKKWTLNALCSLLHNNQERKSQMQQLKLERLWYKQNIGSL